MRAEKTDLQLLLKEGVNRSYLAASPVPLKLYWFIDRFYSLHRNSHTVSLLSVIFLLRLIFFFFFFKLNQDLSF